MIPRQDIPRKAHRTVLLATNPPHPGKLKRAAPGTSPRYEHYREYRKKNTERIRERQRLWRESHRLEMRVYMRTWMRLRRQRNGPGYAKGERNGHAKLDVKRVREMRARYAARNVTMQSLAREYGVSLGGAWKVIRRETWAHV